MSAKERDIMCPKCGDIVKHRKAHRCEDQFERIDHEEYYDDDHGDDIPEESECCGAPIIHGGICSYCKEHCL